MKPSIFNSFIQISDKIGVVYNSLLDKAVFSNATMLIKAIQKSSYSDRLSEEINNTLFVDNDVDEYSIYLQEMLSAEKEGSSYHLIINPTLECIFNCWYCYEAHPKGRIGNLVLDRICKLIQNLSEVYQNLTISFFGGEPLMCYKSAILPIVRYAHSLFSRNGKSFNFNMTTNGFLLFEERIMTMKRYGFTGAQITIDGDRNNHNNIRYLKSGYPSYDRIINNIKILAENGCSVIVRLNCTHDNIGGFNSLSDSLNDLDPLVRNHITIDCHIVWQEKNKDDLQTKMHGLVAHLVENGFKANKMDFRQFCYADKRSQCVINYNGDIFKCTAVDFKNVQRDGFLSDQGEIVWENNSLEHRMSAKQKNMKCKSCRILPLCHGGCSTKALSSEDYCLYPTDNMKNQVVINRLEHIITLRKYE